MTNPAVLTDSTGLPFARMTIYRTRAGREGLIVLTDRGPGTETGYGPLRNAEGRVRFGYLNPDRTQPDMRYAEYTWLTPTELTPVGTLPNCGNCDWCNAFDDDRDEQNGCASCRSEEQNGADAAQDAQDDAAYYVTSTDGTATYAGPFPDWHAANDAAEQVETGNAATGVVTDIRYLTQ